MPTLCEAINDLVEQCLRRALETGETINAPDLASEITESLADLIVTGAPPEEQPRLIDHVVSELDRFVTEKRRAGVGVRLQ
jgi:heptaprenylglyceryl phosphate synthase